MAHSPDMAKFDTLKAQTRTCQSVKLSKPDAVLTAMEPEQQRLTRSASVPTGAGRGGQAAQKVSMKYPYVMQYPCVSKFRDLERLFVSPLYLVLAIVLFCFCFEEIWFFGACWS